MAVDLVKYKEEMLEAWKEVVDDQNPIDWVLYTYYGQSYDLKVASKGGNDLVFVYWFYSEHNFKLSVCLCLSLTLNWFGWVIHSILRLIRWK